jgi:hypothetical protein
MNAREYVETMIVNRLNKQKPDDREVGYLEYCSVMGAIEGYINSTAKNVIIPGFTAEDLESFMGMKVHQILRRGQYDHDRKPHALFSRAFKNLLADIVRMRKKAIENGMEEDILDNCLLTPDFIYKNVHKVNEEK